MGQEGEITFPKNQQQPKPLEPPPSPQRHRTTHLRQSWGRPMPPPPNQNPTISQHKKGGGREY
eukprot:1001196-Ditylum_brightwellii.AAC.1